MPAPQRCLCVSPRITSHKEISCIVAASVTSHKVTKVIAPALSSRTSPCTNVQGGLLNTLEASGLPARAGCGDLRGKVRALRHLPFPNSPPTSTIKAPPIKARMSDPTPNPELDPVTHPSSNPTADQPAIPPANAPAAPSGLSAEPITEFNIGEEFGTAKRYLPPARIVLICIVAIAIVVAVIAFRQRPKPQGGGSIDFVSAVEVPGQNIVLVAITLTLHNTAERSLWIHTLKAQLKAADDKDYEDEAASAVDLDRYFQTFPPLKESTEPPLPPETKLLAGATQRGTIVVSFPLTKEAFDQRKSLAVSIQPYDQPLPVVLK